MKHVKTIPILALCFFSTCLYSQDFEVPENYTFNNSGDYAKYENDILQGIDWLLKKPLNEENVKRKAINKFLMEWITGSPNVSVELNPEIVNFIQPNPDLMMIFMGGWIKHVLETKDNTDKVKGYLKGIESVIGFYQKNIEFLKKDKNVEMYQNMKEKGTLERYILKNIEE